MVGLSEKAKGKQRVVDPQPEATAGSGSAEAAMVHTRTLTVRFTDGLPDLVLTLTPDAKDTVRGVKQQIRQSRPQTAKRRLRLIHSGRILSDSVVLFDWLESLVKRQQKVAVPGERPERVPSVFPNGSAPTWVHCSVGAELTEEDEGEEGDIQRTQIKPLRGFDRLAAAGFSEDDIANFRRTFHSQTSGDYLDTEPLGDDEDNDEHARTLEEQWIDSLDNGSSTSISQSSASTTILQGVVVGFFFPLLPFFFLRDTWPPVFWDDGSMQERTSSIVFSKRMQMALVLGFIVNITFGMWRYLLGG